MPTVWWCKLRLSEAGSTHAGITTCQHDGHCLFTRMQHAFTCRIKCGLSCAISEHYMVDMVCDYECCAAVIAVPAAGAWGG